jgi:hypothetical protein
MAGAPMAATVDRLCRMSRAHRHDPFAALEWPAALTEGAWCMSPELISLQGTPAFDAFDEDARRRLSFWEAVNFFSLNIHGERLLIAGLAARLHVPADDDLSPYLHHFLDEENRHMFYFAEFCRRYAGKIYPDRNLALSRAPAADEEQFLFFAQVLLFEEIVDAYNRRMAADARLADIVREIHRLHHLDEVRHLVFGRRLVRVLRDRCLPRWPRDTRRLIDRRLRDFVEATWKQLYNPAAYAEAGLPEPHVLRRAALAHPAVAARRDDLLAGCEALLQGLRLTSEHDDACS